MAVMALLLGAPTLLADSAGLCATNAPTICWLENEEDRGCSNSYPQDIAARIHKSMETAPEIIRSAYCNLDQVDIYAGRAPFGYGGEAFPDERRIAITADLFGLDIAEIFHYMIDVYEDSFTGVNVDLGSRQPFDTINMGERVPDPVLTYVLLHELAHIVENSYLIASPFRCLDYNEYASLGYSRPEALLDIITRPSEYCAYRIPDNDISNVFAYLSRSPFVSPYSTCRESEDFAETFTLVVLDRYYGFDIKITEGRNTIYSSSDRIRSNSLFGKVAIIGSLIERFEEVESLAELSYEHMTCQLDQ